MGSGRTIDRTQVAALLAQGESVRSIAETMQADPGHMRDVVAEPEVQHIVAKIHREVLDSVKAKMIAAADTGISTLIEACGEGVPWSTREKAAERLLDAVVGRNIRLDVGVGELPDPESPRTQLINIIGQLESGGDPDVLDAVVVGETPKDE